jgi:tetratricopeptide (TPR) repeat protein
MSFVLRLALILALAPAVLAQDRAAPRRALPKDVAATVDSLFNQAAALTDARRHEEAIAAFGKVIALDPQHGEAFRRRAVSFMGLQRYNEALADYNAAAALVPNDARIYVGRGSARRQVRGDVAGALADYTKALALNPKHVSALTSRGNLRFDQNDTDGAEQDCRAALALAAENVDAINCLGRVDLRRRRYASALERFSRIIAIDPKLPFAYYNRAVARSAAGDTTQALLDLEQALALNPAYTNAENLRDRMERAVWRQQAASPAAVARVPSKTDAALAPLAVTQPLDINALTAERYNKMVAAAMEAMRVVQGPLNADEERQFQAAWNPLFDFPTPEGVAYFRRLNPLLVEFLSVRAVIQQATEAFEEAWLDATIAAGYESVQGTADGVVAAQRQREALMSANARVAQIVQAIEAMGNPPLPQEAKARAAARHKDALRVVRAAAKKPTGKPLRVIERRGVIQLNASVPLVVGGSTVEVEAAIPAALAAQAAQFKWLESSILFNDNAPVPSPRTATTLRRRIVVPIANGGNDLFTVTLQGQNAAGRGIAEGIIRVPAQRMRIAAEARSPFAGKTYYFYSRPGFTMEMQQPVRRVGTMSDVSHIGLFKMYVTDYEQATIADRIAGDKSNYDHYLNTQEFQAARSRATYQLTVGPFTGTVYETRYENQSHHFAVFIRGVGVLVAPGAPEHIRVEYELKTNCDNCRANEQEDHSGAIRGESRGLHAALIATMSGARLVPDVPEGTPVEPAEDLEPPEDPKAKEEAIAMHEANIRILEQNLAKDADALSKAADPYQREALEFRVVTGKAEIQSERDLIASLQQGQIVHTRTEYDEYVRGAFISNIRENQEKMEAARRQLAEAQALAKLLPAGEADNARQFIERQLPPDVVATADLAKIQQVRDALLLKADGYRQQYAAAREMAKAEQALMVLEGIRTAGTMAAMYIGGSNAASAYAGFTGFISGGPLEGVKGAASWATPSGFIAAEAIDGYFSGGRVSGPGVIGALEKGASAYAMGKFFEWGVKGVGSAANSIGKRMELWELSYRTGRSQAQLVQEMQRYQQALQNGKKVAFELEQIERQIMSARASGLPVAALEAQALKKAAELNADFYAKKFIKFRGGPELELAALRHTERIYRLVDEEFAKRMKDQGWDMSRLRFKEFRNATSKGFGMDRDYGLVDRGGPLKMVVGKDGKPVLGTDGKPLMVERDPWLIKNGKPSSMAQMQRDGSEAYKQAYEQVTGQSSQKSFQTFTTRVHSESFADLGILKDMKNPENVRVLKKAWGEQAARTIEFKGLEMINDPHLAKVAGYQEACRGLAKEIDKKVVPLLDNVKPGQGLDPAKVAQTQRHLRELQKVFEDFSADKIDPVQASEKIRALTGGKDLPEVLDQIRNITEAVFKFGGVGR